MKLYVKRKFFDDVEKALDWSFEDPRVVKFICIDQAENEPAILRYATYEKTPVPYRGNEYYNKITIVRKNQL